MVSSGNVSAQISCLQRPSIEKESTSYITVRGDRETIFEATDGSQRPSIKERRHSAAAVGVSACMGHNVLEFCRAQDAGPS